jgi:hypothetical protein
MRTIITLVLALLYHTIAIAQTAITAGIQHNGVAASGTYAVYRNGSMISTSLNTLRHPFIFVEGFDPNNEYGISDIYAVASNNGWFNNLTDQLDAQGYDIIILDFDDGGDEIQRNAFLLVELINQINANKPSNSGQLVVAGFSMGGLVSRYALAYMEGQSMNHDTKLYISYDSPHKGAHVPVGIQALALTFKGMTTFFPDLQDALNMFQTPAARQMLKFRLPKLSHPNGDLLPNDDYIDFMTEMEGLNNCKGFPAQCKNIAISLGSWNARPQTYNLDHDNDNALDPQHSGAEILFLNQVTSGGPSSRWIFDLSGCEVEAAFTCQAFISTTFSDQYPYFNDRNNYTGIANNTSAATLLYCNTLNPFFPGGCFSNLWICREKAGDPGVPVDFAPGSFVNIYQQVISSLSEVSDCNVSIADNATFVPTISALCWDTHDYFFNIGNHINNVGMEQALTMTPFDAVIALNDNRPHDGSSQASYAAINSWIMTHVTGNPNYQMYCQPSLALFPGAFTVPFTLSDVYHITSGYAPWGAGVAAPGYLQLKAARSITLEPGLNVSYGGKFLAEIVPCGRKPCIYVHNKPLHKNGNEDQLSDPVIMASIPGQFSTPSGEIRKPVEVYPNPNAGNFTVELNADGLFDIKIINMMSSVVYESKINGGKAHSIDLSPHLPGGTYILQVTGKGLKHIDKITLTR